MTDHDDDDHDVAVFEHDMTNILGFLWKTGVALPGAWKSTTTTFVYCTIL